MNVEIKDLDELIGVNKVKISGYEIDLNDIPLSSFLEVNAAYFIERYQKVYFIVRLLKIYLRVGKLFFILCLIFVF